MKKFAIAALALLAAPVVQAQDAAPLPSAERRQELLFDAARMGRTDLVAGLVKLGADLNGHDARGFTPLILAAYNGHADTLEALIAAGADPCLPDTGQGNTAQMGVAFKGNAAIAARLLKAGCDVDARNKAGQTALMMAALFGRTDQVRMLLAAGADPAIADATGRTAASVAEAQGNTTLAAALKPAVQ
ncbi:ankyrin repeat domain-containing protein [Sphingomonas hengshuiensis]|uniref:ankyrin repeat domain-containing protein n=1 Tax=Sphingomonas hengshuiensis TaxID=1609977 RepID=UPI000696B0B3|nr:ankyrin repeat domain-containing protein [Sphingomonas hengshuiensis]